MTCYGGASHLIRHKESRHKTKNTEETSFGCLLIHLRWNETTVWTAEPFTKSTLFSLCNSRMIWLCTYYSSVSLYGDLQLHSPLAPNTMV